jgi:HAMP domain-containing protein
VSGLFLNRYNMRAFQKIFPRSLKLKILFLMFSGIILSVAISFYIEVYNSKKRLNNELENNLKIISSAIYSILEQTMAKQDLEGVSPVSGSYQNPCDIQTVSGSLKEVTSAFKRLTTNPLLTDVQLMDRDMRPRFASSRGGAVNENKVVTMAIRPRPVCKKCHGATDPIGYLRIGFDISDYRRKFTREMLINVGVSLMLLLSIFASVFICLEKGIFSRLKMINRAMKSFGSGNLREQVKIKGEDELGNMAEAFNEMARNIYRTNYRLVKVSEFSTFIYRKRTEEEVLNETIRFLKKTFNLNGAAIFLNDSDGERLVTYFGEITGLIYNETLVVEMKEIGTLKLAVTGDLTVDELSALSLIASAASVAIERIRQHRVSF